MKLATFIDSGKQALGVVEGDGITNLTALGNPEFSSMLALIDSGEKGLDLARKAKRHNIPLKGIKLLAPLPEPRQMRDGMFFELHLQNCLKMFAKQNGVPANPIPEVWYKQPIYYKANRFAIRGHEEDVHWAKYSKLMDYELELACVIGKTGKDIKRENAFDHIFGFTIFNDFSARDAQRLEMAAQLGPAKGKDFDGANILGPYIVTKDEIGDVYNLKMEARVNGERWGGGNSGSMHHKWDAVLAHISDSETIYAGEIIGSGTVGTGCGLELGKFLKHGDVVELEIEKIGILRNRVFAS